MIRDHSTIEELLAVQALGGLDGDDVDALARLRAEHGDCEECRRLEAEFTDTAGRLAFSVAPVPIDPSIADRILATSAPGEPVGVAADERVADNREARRGRRRWQAVVAVAAAIALVVVSVAVFGPSRTIGINAASTEQRVVRSAGTRGS
jgi:hypothetical protein